MSVNCRAGPCSPRRDAGQSRTWPLSGWQASPRLDLGPAPPSAVGKQQTLHTKPKAPYGSLAPTSQVADRGHRGLSPTARGTFIPEDTVP